MLQLTRGRSLLLGWKRLVAEGKERADLHLQISETLKKSVADPLTAYSEQLKKDLKLQYAPIDKAFKNFMDALANSIKVVLVWH